PEEAAKVFKTSHEIGYEWHVRHQAAFQRYTDNGVSKTINLPNDASEDDVAAAYKLAWELGCLGITVFRDGCKGEQVLNVGVKDKPAAAAPSRWASARARCFRCPTPWRARWPSTPASSSTSRKRRRWPRPPRIAASVTSARSAARPRSSTRRGARSASPAGTTSAEA